MMCYSKSRICGLLIVGVSIWSLMGCPRKPPPNYYLLDPGTPTHINEVPSGIAIGVGPLWVAPHLNRRQVVTRLSETDLKISDAHQWAAPVKDSVLYVIAANIAVELNTNRIYEFPMRRRRHLDYQVAIDLLRLDGQLGGDVILEARWILSSGDGKKILISRVTRIVKQSLGVNYSSYILAKSLVVAELAKEIAQTIKTQSK